jgi:hypothetical protein
MEKTSNDYFPRGFELRPVNSGLIEKPRVVEILAGAQKKKSTSRV